MYWWVYVILYIVIAIVFGLPIALVEESNFIDDKNDSYEDKKTKLENYINKIQDFKKNKDQTILNEIKYKNKIYQRLLSKFGYVKNFKKYGKNITVKNFKVISDSLNEIDKLMLTQVTGNYIEEYCNLMIEKISTVISIYIDLIDQIDEISTYPLKKYVYYLEHIIILPITIITYILTRPFTIFKGSFNINDKLDINKWWHLCRFILSICAEIATIISVFIQIQ